MHPEPRHEIWRSRVIIGIATLVGLALRLWPFGRLGFNQFDEGVYGMVAWWILNPGGLGSIDSTLIPYAPPGYPILIGLVSWVVGFSDQASVLVSASLGSLTIPVVYRIGCRIVSQRAGLISAWCICCSGPHIAFSRMGLTDASFLLVWSIGFLVGLRFLQTPGIITGIALGALVGLSQQFKYNGWLLGGLVIVTAFLGLMISPSARDRQYLKRVAIWGGLAVITAWSVVEPWYRFVDAHGGYAKLLTHQRSYLGGSSSWWPHLRNQVDQAVALSGPSWLALVNILAVVVSLRFTSTRSSGSIGSSERPTGWPQLLTLGLLWPMLAAPATAGLLGLAGRPTIQETGKRLLLTSWLVLFLLTPFYHPYARLWLPFELVHWIVLGQIGSNLQPLSPRPEQAQRPLRGRRLFMGFISLVATGSLIFGPGFPLATPSSWNHDGLFDPSDSLRQVAAKIVEQVPPNVTRVRTLVRPAMTYYLVGRIGLALQPDAKQLEKGDDSQEWGLVDSTLLLSDSNLSALVSHDSLISLFLTRWEIVTAFPADTTLPTSLDLQPMNSDRSATAKATFWLIRLRHPDRTP